MGARTSPLCGAIAGGPLGAPDASAHGPGSPAAALGGGGAPSGAAPAAPAAAHGHGAAPPAFAAASSKLCTIITGRMTSAEAS